MPTISIFKDDFESLLGSQRTSAVSIDQIEEWLMLVKGELKGHNAETGELRVELQDSNRPDLWCCEGIARQIRIKQQGKLRPYPFLGTRSKPTQRVIVGAGMERVRPYVAACTAKGYRVTKEGLAQLIQTQEKLADIFGHKRKTVSIGIYQLQKIAFPVTYELVKPDDARFTPLGMETVMTLSEILMVHPKGLEHGRILAGHSRLPILRDAKRQPLSFPPIINSREIGEVRVGDDELFVEVTGTDLAMVVLTLNIFAVNLADRGAVIEPVAVQYPHKTPLGRRVVTPQDLGKSRSIRIETIERALGQALGGKTVTQALKTYGYDVSAGKSSVKAKLPPYRQDLMHEMDVVEDVAMSCGYGSFAPEMPAQFSQPESASNIPGCLLGPYLPPFLKRPNATGEKRRNDKTVVGLFSVHDHEMFTQFYLTNRNQLAIAAKQDAVRIRQGLNHIRTQSSKFTMLFGDMCPSFIRESNVNSAL
ncbi:MAG: phenylalanine--tRNA ligase subunit beta [Nitrospira sp.]|nr:phenylalanine--tRNA ligase subunit beta [Nitrospira sp.]